MYQPEITEENIRRLYFLKVERKKPMTKLVNEILNDFFKNHKQVLDKGGDRDERIS